MLLDLFISKPTWFYNSYSCTKDPFHFLCETWGNYFLDLFIGEQCKFYCHNI